MDRFELAVRVSGYDLVQASQVVMKELHLSVTNTWGGRTLPVGSSEWKALREEILKREDYKCRFCSHRSMNFMVVDHMNGVASDNRHENLGVNCQMCDKIRHCGLAGLKEMIMLGTSVVPQVEIVKRTREYFRVNRRIPKATMVDPQARPAQGMTIVEFADVLMKQEWERLPRSMKSYRGFFTGKFDRWQV